MSRATIIAKARLIPRDFGEPFHDSYSGDGVTRQFPLSRQSIDPASVVVKLNGSALTPAASLPAVTTGQYFLDSATGMLSLSAPLAGGSTLVVDGTAYISLRSGDLDNYVDIAFDLHSHGVVPPVTMDDLSPTEEYLVAMLAMIEALWGEAAAASQEIDIITPEGVQIPRSQRFAQILSLIERIQAHYRELAAALNVGPYRIQVLNLRRVSRTTNRLVPVYVEQEFDDRTYPPVRVFPPIDTGLT